MISVNLEASNKADWTIQITAVDAETDEEIDFTGASISFVVKDSCGVTVLTATTTNGNITLPTGVLIEIQFTPDQMGAVCSGHYSLGCVYEINDETTQLLTGYVDIYDGIASL
jgi:hypothetical protein